MITAQKRDGLLSGILLSLAFYYSFVQYEVMSGKFIHLGFTLVAAGLSFWAAMSVKKKTNYFLNLILSVYLLGLFCLSVAIRFAGMGDWYFAEAFSVNQLDVIVTGVFGTLFLANALWTLQMSDAELL